MFAAARPLFGQRLLSQQRHLAQRATGAFTRAKVTTVCTSRLRFSSSTSVQSGSPTLQSPTTTLATARFIPSALPNKTIRSILASAQPDTHVKVQGWIRSTRQQKNVTFVEVNDGSTLKGIQAILSGGEGKG